MRALVAIVFAAIAAACSVEHKSDNYACNKNTDCPMGRFCNDGFCVLAGSIDAPKPMTDAPRGDGGGNQCPAPCTSCNVSAKTCAINCSLTQACQNAFACPPGYKCDITCSGDNACRNGINCQQAASCSIECQGRGSCEDVLCGPGPCDVGCSGPQTCKDISCGNSCACDVVCTGSQSCQSGIQCTSVACRSGLGCTSVPLVCRSCTP